MNINAANTLLQTFTSSHSGKGKYPDGFQRVEDSLEVFTENEIPFLAYSLWGIAKLSEDKWTKLVSSWKNGAFSPDADNTSEKTQVAVPDGKHTLSSKDYLSLRYTRLVTLWAERNKDSILKGKKVSFSIMDELNLYEDMVQEYMDIKQFEDTLAKHLPNCEYFYLSVIPGKSITLYVEKSHVSSLINDGYAVVKDKGVIVGKLKPGTKPDEFGEYLPEDKVYLLKKDIGL